ncbi:MAG: hypothetical protein ACI9S8_000276, partial [Chlamydiales bacterium]
MTWRSTSVEKVRLEFIKQYFQGTQTCSDLCKAYDI